MPDMNKAQLTIPEIDELLTPTTSSMTTGNYEGTSRSSETHCAREYTEGSMSRVDSLEFDRII